MAGLKWQKVCKLINCSLTNNEKVVLTNAWAILFLIALNNTIPTVGDSEMNIFLPSVYFSVWKLIDKVHLGTNQICILYLPNYPSNY